MKKSTINISCIIILLTIVSACNSPSKQEKAIEANNPITISKGAYKASSPHFTKNKNGAPVLSWVQQNDSAGSTMMYYAYFSKDKKTFGKPHAIPSSNGVSAHGENMPKLVFLKDGNLLAVFTVKHSTPKNSYSGLVYYTESTDKGENWTKAKRLIKDSTFSFDQRYFDIALMPNGKVGITWLNNSDPKGSYLYFSTFTSKKGFSKPIMVASHTCQCCRTDLMVEPSGKINIAWRDLYKDSIRDMFYSHSTDAGKTFSKPTRISPDNWVVYGCPHTGPSMAENNDGTNFVWFTMGGGGGIYYCHSDNSGKIFSHRTAVHKSDVARHPQIISLPNNNLFIAWDDVIYDKTNNQSGTPTIGIQERDAKGEILKTQFLTQDSTIKTFPVLESLNNKSVLLAYTQTKNRRQVCYKLLSLNKDKIKSAL